MCHGIVYQLLVLASESQCDEINILFLRSQLVYGERVIPLVGIGNSTEGFALTTTQDQENNQLKTQAHKEKATRLVQMCSLLVVKLCCVVIWLLLVLDAFNEPDSVVNSHERNVDAILVQW